MQYYTAAIRIFPEPLRRVLSLVPPLIQTYTQEIRLRAGQAVSLGYGGKEHDIQQLCSHEWLQQTVDVLSNGSLYAHQEELRCGFLTTADGCRVGIAGTAVIQAGHLVGYRDISALCVRIAREHQHCAEILHPLLYDGKPHSILLCGEPSSGKTSLLRDSIRILKTESLSVAVIDERGELSVKNIGCDVMKFTPKAKGLEQAIRCLAPQVVVFDELGDEIEWQAVTDAMLRGVPTVTTVHCRDPRELICRNGALNALQSGIFEHLVVLEGKEQPGRIKAIYKTEEWLHESVRFFVGSHRGSRSGLV